MKEEEREGEEEQEEETGNKDSLHLSGSRTLWWRRLWEEAEGGAMREGGSRVAQAAKSSETCGKRSLPGQ